MLLTETRQQVAYRWTETPFEPPRLLIDEARTSAETLRARLETILGEPLRAGEYRIVVRAADHQVIQATFSDLEIIGDAPDEADVFALIEWRFEPPDFDALCDYLEATLIDPLEDAEQVRIDFQAVRDAIRVVIAGRSARALTDVYQQITGETISLPRTPSKQAMIERRFRGVPITILDLRAGAMPEIPANVLLIIAAASDPGIGQEELARLENAEQAMVAVINTHDDERHFAAMIAYIQEEVGAIPIITDNVPISQDGGELSGGTVPIAPDKPYYRKLSIRLRSHRVIEHEIRARLLSWLDSLPASAERSRVQAFIENFSL